MMSTTMKQIPTMARKHGNQDTRHDPEHQPLPDSVPSSGTLRFRPLTTR